MSEDDVYYLRSILGMLQEIRKGEAVDAENLADNIEWLAVFIAKLTRAD